MVARPTLFLVLNKHNDGAAQCADAIAGEIATKYSMNVGLVDKAPKFNELGPDDKVAEIEKNGKGMGCY